MRHPLDRMAYRRRNAIERMLCRMKGWRRFATRYDRLARNFLDTVALVATACFWEDGMTSLIPQPMTSGAKTDGRFGKQDFV